MMEPEKFVVEGAGGGEEGGDEVLVMDKFR